MDTLERYKLITEEHRFASDFRAKNISMLGLSYAALAAAFAWVYRELWSISCVVPLIAALITYVNLLADKRIRRGLHVCVDIGEAIELDTGIPFAKRYFSQLKAGQEIPHSKVIDYGSWIAIAFLSAGFLWLLLSVFCHKWYVPQCLCQRLQSVLPTPHQEFYYE